MLTIQFTIDRFEGEDCILKNGTETVIWPKNKLPENAHEGMELVFNIMDNAETEKEKKNLAKDILNDILNTEE